MDWVLGTLALFCYAAGLSTLAFAIMAMAIVTSIGTIAVRLRARGQGILPDDGWMAPKLFTALVLLVAVWCLAARAGFVGA